MRKLPGSWVPFWPPNKRVQSDAAPRPGIGTQLGYVTRFELKRISEKSRRG